VKKGPIVAGAALALAMGLIVVPNAAFAQRSRGAMVSGGTRVFVGSGGRAFVGGGGRVVVGGGRAGVAPGFAHHPGFAPGFGHHPGFVHRPFVRPFFPFGVGVVAAAPFVYGAPYYYPPSDYYYPPPAYYPSAYYDPPVSYDAPARYGAPPSGTIAVAPAPPQAPPTPNVVQFDTGRYELRGDGVSAPYTWVWIPNPPTAPPPAAPTAPPVGPSSSNGQVPPRAGHLYRWTDAQGVIYWTDRLDAVPEQYRSKVKSTSS
jgi:hypothetical protein